VPRLSAIYIYPVKSCRGISLDTAEVSAIGLAGDRLWQVVEGNGRCLTQRQHPVLATVQPEPMDGGGLRLHAADQPSIEVAPPGAQTMTVKSLFGVRVPATDAGDEAAEWFSALTGASVRLAAMVDCCGWRPPGDFDLFGQSSPFADAAPILLTAESSIDWLRERASEDFGMDRFRPNLVVAGSEPWAEDTWTSVRIGQAEVRPALPWPRCEIPQVDQITAQHHREPAKVLRAHRWCTDAPTLHGDVRRLVEGSGLFGVGCSIGAPGATVRVGDAVTVTTTSSPVLSMS
jgi:uncharacterized protein YcbX